MSGIADDGPLAGVTIGSVIGAIGWLIVWLKKWLQERERKRDMDAVPASKPIEHDPQAAAAVLRRLDAIEHETALSVALYRERQAVDDLRRELAETRAERDQLTVELRAERALTARLRSELARAKARGRGVAAEVSVAEHRDASQAGTLQDSLQTPLRPGPRKA